MHFVTTQINFSKSSFKKYQILGQEQILKKFIGRQSFQVYSSKKEE